MTAGDGSSRISELLASFEGRRVLVVGDLIADEYVFGETARLSREAPVMILRHAGRRVIAGGAGNAVLNLKALGAVPVPVALVGDGETSREMVAGLAARGIATEGILCDPERVAVRKTRIMAGGVHGQKQQILRIDQEDTTPIPAALEGRLRDLAEEAMDDVEAVLLSDYGYGTLDASVRDDVIDGARRRGLPLCADSRYRLREFVGVTWATPNEDEAALAWGRPIRDEDDLRGAAEAADVTGAGDTVAAASLLATVAGGTPREAAELASIAAGIVVQKHGAATTTREEIERALGAHRQSPQR